MGTFTAPTQTDRDFHPVDKTYAHLTGQDIDKEVLVWYGIIPQEEAEERCLEPVQCPGCKTINAPCANYCSTCGRSFTDGGGHTGGDGQGRAGEREECTIR